MVPSQHLEELVKGYKLSLRSFGFAPVVYDDNVLGMTQIEEEVSFSVDVDVDHESDAGTGIGGIVYESPSR